MGQNIIGLLNPLLAAIFSGAFFFLWFIQKKNRYILAVSGGYLSFACGMFVSNVAIEADETLHVLGTHIFYSIACISLVWSVLCRAEQPAYLWLTLLLAIAAAPLLVWIHGNSELANIRIIIANAVYSAILFVGAWGLWKNRHNHRLDFLLFIMFALMASQFLIRPAAVLALEGNLPNKEYIDSIYYSTLNVTMAMLSLMLALSLLAVCILDYINGTLKRRTRSGVRTEDVSDEEKASRLKQVMETGIHRRPDLSISMLAEATEIQEYQLGRLINQAMGYRNFREFLNSYRLKEVQSALSSPALDYASITTIAFDSGFNSIPSFNRVFKTELGMAPSQYRNEQIAKRKIERRGENTSHFPK